MKNIKPFVVALTFFLLFGCSAVNNQKKGTVQPKEFNYETAFITYKTIVIVPFEINGITKNFYFDTGAQYSIIQRDSIIGKTETVTGASNRQMKFGTEIVNSLKIGNVDFRNTVALNGDMVGLKEQIPNFGGLIGQTILNKSNWLIDYPNKKLQISNQNLVDNNTFKTIKINREGGSPYTYISINGIKYKVLIDFGSSSEFSLPKESKLAKQLLQHYEFTDNERKRWTIGGLQTIKEKVGMVPLVKLGDIEFKNVSTKINVQSQPRLGIGFFKNCKVYIDNLEHCYKIKKVE